MGSFFAAFLFGGIEISLLILFFCFLRVGRRKLVPLTIAAKFLLYAVAVFFANKYLYCISKFITGYIAGICIFAFLIPIVLAITEQLKSKQ